MLKYKKKLSLVPEHFTKTFKKKKLRFTFAPIIAVVSALCGYYAAPQMGVKGPVQWRMCFTPGEPCLPLILDALRKAKRTIDIQAYTLTSASIARSLVEAKKRGIKIRVLLDKTQRINPHGQLHLLKKGRLEIRIDYKPAIAHNKVIVIDRRYTLTGSYNWTESAERRNAENLLLIDNKSIAKRYSLNFEKRWMLSMPIHRKTNSKKSHFRRFKW